MKRFSLIILSILLLGSISAQKFSINAKAGPSLHIKSPLKQTDYSKDWKKPNVNVNFQVNYAVADPFWMGIGAAYTSIEFLPSSNFFTFDKQYASVYVAFFYDIIVSSRISIITEINVGYSIGKSLVNEVPDEKRSFSGFYGAAEIDVNFTVFDNFSIMAGIHFNTTLAKLKRPDINTTLFIDEYSNFHRITQFVPKVGLMYKF